MTAPETTGPDPRDPSAGGPPRAVRLDGSHNLRDLGGLPTRSGGTVRRGRVFRAEFPRFAPESLGLVSVVDLRRPSEVDFESVDWAARGVRATQVSLSAGRLSSWEADYPAYFEHKPQAVVDAVRALLDPGAHPALFHCAAGKDRTGVIAAVLLLLLDVEPDVIVADYLLTEAGLSPILARLADGAPYQELFGKRTREQFSPLAATMSQLLSWLEDQGGAEAWLVAHGIEPAEIAAFRDEMVEGD